MSLFAFTLLVITAIYLTHSSKAQQRTLIGDECCLEEWQNSLTTRMIQQFQTHLNDLATNPDFRKAYSEWEAEYKQGAYISDKPGGICQGRPNFKCTVEKRCECNDVEHFKFVSGPYPRNQDCWSDGAGGFCYNFTSFRPNENGDGNVICNHGLKCELLAGSGFGFCRTDPANPAPTEDPQIVRENQLNDLKDEFLEKPGTEFFAAEEKWKSCLDQVGIDYNKVCDEKKQRQDEFEAGLALFKKLNMTTAEPPMEPSDAERRAIYESEIAAALNHCRSPSTCLNDTCTCPTCPTKENRNCRECNFTIVANSNAKCDDEIGALIQAENVLAESQSKAAELTLPPIGNVDCVKSNFVVVVVGVIVAAIVVAGVGVGFPTSFQ